MPTDSDVILLETIRTHRERLRSAFIYGQLPERRLVTDNVRRFIASVVVASVVCSACVGISFVGQLLGSPAANTPAPAPTGATTVVK